MPSIGGESFGGFDGFCLGKFGGDAGAHRTARAEVLGQRAGVDALDAEDVVAFQDMTERLAVERQLDGTSQSSPMTNARMCGWRIRCPRG